MSCLRPACARYSHLVPRPPLLAPVHCGATDICFPPPPPAPRGTARCRRQCRDGNEEYVVASRARPAGGGGGIQRLFGIRRLSLFGIRCFFGSPGIGQHWRVVVDYAGTSRYPPFSCAIILLRRMHGARSSGFQTGASALTCTRALPPATSGRVACNRTDREVGEIHHQAAKVKRCGRRHRQRRIQEIEG